MTTSRIHIHSPATTAKESSLVDCPDCKKKHPKARRQSLHLMFFTPWYGWDRYCLCCGRKWSDGEWMPLGFYPDARKDNIQWAKKTWREMPPVSANHYGIDP